MIMWFHLYLHFKREADYTPLWKDMNLKFRYGRAASYCLKRCQRGG